jgi:type II secretory pathway component PulJ
MILAALMAAAIGAAVAWAADAATKQQRLEDRLGALERAQARMEVLEGDDRRGLGRCVLKGGEP